MAVQPVSEGEAVWGIGEMAPSLATDAAVCVAVALDAEQFDRLIDRGPPSDHSGADAFR